MCIVDKVNRGLGYLFKAWRISVFVGVGVLCVRLLIAVCVQEAGNWIAPFWLISAGALMVWRNPGATFFALAAAIPLLNGIERLDVPFAAPPVEILFSAIYLGWIARWARSNRSSIFTTDAVAVIADLFISLILISMVFGVLRNLNLSGVSELWQMPRFGFAAHYFGITSGFALISGTMFLRIVTGKNESRWSESKGTGTVVIVQAVTIFCFVGYQFLTGTPELYRTHMSSGSIFYIPTLPGDDIHTLGSMAVVIFGYSLSRAAYGIVRGRVLWAGVSMLGGAVVVLSWSRAAWLAASCLVPLWLWRRGFKRSVAVCCLGAALLVIGLALVPVKAQALENPFGQRLILLIDAGHWLQTNSDRIDLYKRALRIMKAHPALGIGAGNFFSQSLRYEKPDYRGEMKFAHNAFLQVGAESGVIAMLCFLGWIGILLNGASSIRRENQWRLVEAPWLASVGMLVTQLSANAINIFPAQMLLLCVYLGAVQVQSSSKHLSGTLGNGPDGLQDDLNIKH